MEKSYMPAQLVGSETHGFRTMPELDVPTMMEEAKNRWFRPNEIHAILCNYNHFTVYVKPLHLPKSGTVVLFDRRKFRNFRKDGHNWKKKKDGKTVKEAHEHLKVGNEEKIHVYYAHGEENPTFVRRCYWLLDKMQEHIVLVHYRETRETQGSPFTPLYSSHGSAISDPPVSWLLSEEFDSVVDPAYFSTQGSQFSEANDSLTVKSHEMRLHEINTLEWDELVVKDNFSNVDTAHEGRTSLSEQPRYEKDGYGVAARSSIMSDNISFQPSRGQMISDAQRNEPESITSGTTDLFDNLRRDDLESQDSFGGWMNSITTDSPTSLEDPMRKSSISVGDDTFASAPLNHHLSSSKGQIFSITDISPAWALSNEETKGQGVIHLCAILGYTWAVYPFSWAGQSLDYRDKFGWTALHWAAYFGREKMIATLQSAGAKSYLVTDPTPENPGGMTAADIASKRGHEGLAAFLAEKSLVEQFRDMKVAGNAIGSLHDTTDDAVIPGKFTEDELYLKDTLAAFRRAADAATRIQTAFRERSFKLRKKAVESSTLEFDALNTIAALKIQHAFRNFQRRKEMASAERIQCRFRTWKIRKDFLNLRLQTIKIQAVFRGFQARRQYKRIVWSVGVLEKAILRWRLKRKGIRGLQINPDEDINSQKQENDVEEDFFQASRKQAEERVERSVEGVQAMFHSKRAQEEYRRMKLAHNEVSAEFEGLQDPDMELD